jgi:N-acetylglucosaminyldiphosphoundecaprenol N-acetyl-beta-D-mannosaminyltransferase
MHPCLAGHTTVNEIHPTEQRVLLGMKVDCTSYADATSRIIHWAHDAQSRSVFAANVHTVMEAYDDPVFKQFINQGDLATPDGMPLVWSLRLQGLPQAARVYGPDLMPAVLNAAERASLNVGFYGATPAVLQALLSRLRRQNPNLRITYVQAPPFRPLTAEEDRDVIRAITQSQTRILFVGLGCPKQERWIAMHRGSIPWVMLGVGAAFDFLAGSKPQAPHWMQSSGLEWVFRLAAEPKRLWSRYAKHNPRFAVLMLRQLLWHRGEVAPAEIS